MEVDLDEPGSGRPRRPRFPATCPTTTARATRPRRAPRSPSVRRGSDAARSDGAGPAGRACSRGRVVIAGLLVAGGAVQGGRNEAARIERVVAAPGGVRPLGADLTVAWRIDPSSEPGETAQGRWAQPALVSGTLVVPGAPVAGYDPRPERCSGADRSRRTLRPGTGS
ncbi:hypothetical protein NKG05_25120 [Oerskovia sp. M15]